MGEVPIVRTSETTSHSTLQRWLLEGQVDRPEGPGIREGRHQPEAWWRVMCLTGVDYFSTLGYQPGIAALAAGVLSPVATVVLILLTLFGALPIYRRVAMESPHGEGSIAMLERLLGWWQGKLLVLILLGFVATDFIITITLSTADATAHLAENPFFQSIVSQQRVPITILFITLLGAVFLRGFGEAIGIAVILVIAYLGLNLVVIVVSLSQIVANPAVLFDWQRLLFGQYPNPVMMVAAAMLVFPKLALGLSGFETGVALMPLVQGRDGNAPGRSAGRIRNTHKLLVSAAIIMSIFLFFSSIVTTLLIPAEAFQPGGEANGRALAYLAHHYLGDGFGTVYDICTIAILWFAGASAMAGLLNIVPRYLPRYGMAPEWTRANRPLVIVFTLIAFLVTVIFQADVDAQGGAYATGVLVLMTSAAVAVTLSARQRRWRMGVIGFGAIAAVFIYTTVINVIERPDGIRIASVFILAIIVTSLISRSLRSTELRVSEVDFDATAQQYIREAAVSGTLRFIANHPDERDAREYLLKEREEREASHIPQGDPVLFLEVRIADASDFAPKVKVSGEQIDDFRVLRVDAASIPNAIAAVLLRARDMTGLRPHAYFGWVEGNPIGYLARFILFGEGDIAPVTREILRQAEPDTRSRPAVHVG